MEITLAEAARSYPRAWEARGEDLVVVLPDSGEHTLGDVEYPRSGSVRAEVCFASGAQAWMTFPADIPVRVYA
jgi:hypothetical protein